MNSLNPLYLCQVAVIAGGWGWVLYFCVFLPFSYLVAYGGG